MYWIVLTPSGFSNQKKFTNILTSEGKYARNNDSKGKDYSQFMPDAKYNHYKMAA